MSKRAQRAPERRQKRREGKAGMGQAKASLGSNKVDSVSLSYPKAKDIGCHGVSL